LIVIPMQENKPVIHINLRVRASISTGKSTVFLGNISEQAVQGVGVPRLSPDSTVHTYDFHIGAWMGGDNPHMAFEMLKSRPDGTGEAIISVPVLPGDTNTLKLGIYIRDPETQMQRHIASGFEIISTLADNVNGVTSCDAAKASLLLKDNYSKNQAILHFANFDTDIPRLKSVCAQLKPSFMLKSTVLNQKVGEMTLGLHKMIEKISSVSNLNGGPNFVNSMCFTQSMGCAINYPLLNMTYDSTRHRTPLPMLSYMALATLHYTGLSADDALAMPEHEFIQKFVVPMCTSFTVCPNSMVYSGDKTLDVKGNLDQATEDFGMVQCHHYFIGVNGNYNNRFNNLSEMSNNQLNEHLSSLAACPCDNSKGHFLIADDCETLAGQIKSIAGGIHLASHVLADGCEVKLGNMMWDCTRDMPNLAAVPKEDFHACAKLLNRYGALNENSKRGVLPSAQVGMGIVSAKGASFTMGKSELNGHACTVAQTLMADGKASYVIGEGTTNLRMRNLSDSCPKKVNILLAEGSKMFSTTEALSVIAQNMGDMTSTKGKTRVAQTIPYSFEGKDAYTSCPFYMGGFFIGLEMGPNIPGIIPLDTQRHFNPVLAGDADGLRSSDGQIRWTDATPSGKIDSLSAEPTQPLFGAPVANLCADTVKAIPINLAAVMGQTMAGEFLGGILGRNLESTPPRASESKLKELMSPWGPLGALAKQSIDTPAQWILSCAEGFGDADMLRGVAEYKTRLAREFNALQDKDPIGDGIKMTVKMHMLSVVSHFVVPLPVREKWDLSCAKNMRLALKALPFGGAPRGIKSQFSLI
jgi:hypothetical protein